MQEGWNNQVWVRPGNYWNDSRIEIDKYMTLRKIYKEYEDVKNKLWSLVWLIGISIPMWDF